MKAINTCGTLICECGYAMKADLWENRQEGKIKFWCTYWKCEHRDKAFWYTMPVVELEPA